VQRKENTIHDRIDGLRQTLDRLHTALDQFEASTTTIVANGHDQARQQTPGIHALCNSWARQMRELLRVRCIRQP